MSNEITLAAIVVAAIVVIYLLRHVIALAFRLIILAALVLAGYWVWQNRAELIDAAEPYLGGVGDSLRELDLQDLPGLSGDGNEPEDADGLDILGVVEELVPPEIRPDFDGSDDPERPGDPANPGQGR